jgi:hypothetical protein
MATPTPKPERGQSEQGRRFTEALGKNGHLVDVTDNEDTSKLPARVTHVRYPDRTVKRIRLTASGYR